jgi:hypothetical protein
VNIFQAGLRSDGMIHFLDKSGTGFFIRAKGKLFLVSAKHVLTPWNCDSVRAIYPFPDTARIRLYTKDGDWNYVLVDLKKIKDTITGSNCIDDPDIFVMPFPDIPGFAINSIEAFIKPFENIPDSATIVYCGFPHEHITPESFRRVINSKPSMSTGFTLYPFANPYLHNNRIDTINVFMQRFDTLSVPGYSGSPVFLKNARGEWIFCGVTSHGSSTYPFTVFVRSKFVMEKIEALLSQIK